MVCSSCGYKNTDTATFCVICGNKLVSSEVFQAGKTESVAEKPKESAKPDRQDATLLREGRYQIIRKLGEGGMGKIYLSKDTKMDYLVVIKELLPLFMTQSEREYMEKRFQEEARILFRLDYRGMPKVMDYFSENEKMYIVMQYVEGKNLAQIVAERQNRRITVDEALNWMDDILDILNYLHGQDPPIIHRDVKPKNIMINNRGDVYLVDFGLARTIGMQTSTGTSVGTYGYSSPEHYSGKFDLTSDIYSLGATFHYLLSGDDPQKRDSFDFPPLSDYIPDFPEKLQQIFDTMLNIQRSKRYQNIEEVRTALKSYREERESGKTAEIVSSMAPETARIPAETRNFSDTLETSDLPLSSSVLNRTNRFKDSGSKETNIMPSDYEHLKKQHSKTKNLLMLIAIIAVIAIISTILTLAISKGIFKREEGKARKEIGRAIENEVKRELAKIVSATTPARSPAPGNTTAPDSKHALITIPSSIDADAVEFINDHNEEIEFTRDSGDFNGVALQLPPGRYNIRLLKSGYYPIDRNRIRAESGKTVSFEGLKPDWIKKPSIIVKVNAAAQIKLHHEDTGKSFPAHIATQKPEEPGTYHVIHNNLEEGVYKITAKHEDFESVTKTEDIQKGDEDVTVHIHLPPKTPPAEQNSRLKPDIPSLDSGNPQGGIPTADMTSMNDVEESDPRIKTDFQRMLQNLPPGKRKQVIERFRRLAPAQKLLFLERMKKGDLR